MYHAPDAPQSLIITLTKHHLSILFHKECCLPTVFYYNWNFVVFIMLYLYSVPLNRLQWLEQQCTRSAWLCISTIISSFTSEVLPSGTNIVLDMYMCKWALRPILLPITSKYQNLCCIMKMILTASLLWGCFFFWGGGRVFFKVVICLLYTIIQAVTLVAGLKHFFALNFSDN